MTWADKNRDAANNPAAPAGLQQVADRHGQGGRSQDGGGRLSPWKAHVEDSGYIGAQQDWFSGANYADVKNGWDTEFRKEWLQREEKAFASGQDSFQYFTNPENKATGVVLWGTQDAEEAKAKYDGLQFGDVYRDGKKVGNIYTDYDRNTANELAAMLLPTINLNDLFEDDDFIKEMKVAREKPNQVSETLDLEVRRALDEINRGLEEGRAARDLDRNVKDQDWAYGTEADVATVAAGAAGGAATGAGAGSVIPGLGTGVGALVGGIAGGLGAWLNRDELQHQVARGKVIVEQAWNQESWQTAVGETAKQFGGVLMSVAAPSTNLYHGVYDELQGTAGDQRSEFQEDVIEGGKKSWALTLGNVGTMFIDSAAQFGAKAGRQMFYTGMGSNLAGSVVQATPLVGGEGRTFDYRSASYDSFYTNEDGEFDKSSTAAGLLNVAVEAVQVALPAGLTKAAQGTRASSGVEAAETGGGIWSRMPGRWGRQVDEGEEIVRVGGMTGVRKKATADEAAGAVRDLRPSVAMVAPSEHFIALTARAKVARAAALSKNPATADDFYREAVNLTAGTSAKQVMLATGLAEGYEEAMQAVLEPISHEHNPDAAEIGQSFLAGFGMGAGMGRTVWQGAASQDDFMWARASMLSQEREGRPITREEWASLDNRNKETLAAGRTDFEKMRSAGLERYFDGQAAGAVATIPELQVLVDAAEDLKDSAARQNLPAINGTYGMGQFTAAAVTDVQGRTVPGAPSEDSVVGSFDAVLDLLRTRAEGLRVQRAHALPRRVAQLEQAVASAVTDEQRAELQSRIDGTEREAKVLDRAAELADVLVNDLTGLRERMRGMSMGQAQTTVRAVNIELRKAFEGVRPGDKPLSIGGVELTDPDDIDALQRAVTVIAGRDPHDQPGSFVGLIPQVNARATMQNENGALKVSPAILKAINGDWDGDKLRTLNELFLDGEAFGMIRAGAHFTGAGSSVAIDSHSMERKIVERLSSYLRPSTDTYRMGLASSAIEAIVTRITNRFAGAVPAAELDSALEAFKDEVRANNPDAVMFLRDRMARGQLGGALQQYGIDNRYNVWLGITQIALSEMRKFQTKAVTRDPQIARTEAARTAPGGRARTRRQVPGATPLTTAMNVSGRSQVFRLFTTLHYTSDSSAVVRADERAPQQLDEAIRAYEELTSGRTQTATEDIREKDEHARRVRAWIKSISRGQVEQELQLNGVAADAVVANTMVEELTFDDFGNATGFSKNKITLAQQLLRMSLNIERREKAGVWATDTTLQGRHSKLSSMTYPGAQNAGRAFIEIYGSMPAIDVLGTAAVGGLRPSLTLDQHVRLLQVHSADTRRAFERELKAAPEYGVRELNTDMPYALEEVLPDEVDGSRVTAYRSVVDSLLAAVRGKIALDSEGHTVGELAETNDRTHKQFTTVAYEEIQKALFEYRKTHPLQKGERVGDKIKQMLNQDPALVRKLMEILPSSIMPLVYSRDGEKVRVARWVYEAFAKKDAEEAAAYFWSHMLLAEVEVARKQPYSALPRRTQQLVYRLEKLEDGGRLLDEFISRVTSAKNLRELFQWINTHPVLRGDQAPLLPWVDDVAEFSPDKAKGGWGVSLPGSAMREAIASFATSTQRMVDHQNADSELLNSVKERNTRIALREAFAQFDGENLSSVTNPEYREKLAGFLEAFQNANRRGTLLGERSLMLALVGALPGIDGKSHDKAKTQPHLRGLGRWLNTHDRFGLTSNPMQLLQALTSYDQRSVTANLSRLAGRDVRTMGDNGEQVLWENMGPRELFELYDNEDTQAMASEILFPMVVDVDPGSGITSRKYQQGRSIADLVDGTYDGRMFQHGPDGRVTADAAQRYLSVAISETVAQGGDPYTLLTDVANLMMTRLSALDRPAAQEEDAIGWYESTAVESVRDYVTQMQMNASRITVTEDGAFIPDMEVTSAGDQVPVLELLGKKVRRRLRDRMAEKAFGYTGLEGQSVEEYVRETLMGRLEQHTAEVVEENLAAAEQEISNVATEVEVARSLTKARDQAVAQDAIRKRIELLLSDDTLGTILEDYGFAINSKKQLMPGVSNELTKAHLIRYAVNNRGFAATIPSISDKVYLLTQDLTKMDEITLEDDEWLLLSKAVIDHRVNNLLTTGAPTSTRSLYSETDRMTDKNVIDETFGYTTHALFDAHSPIMRAGAILHAATHNRNDKYDDTDIEEHVFRQLLSEQKLGPWTADIALHTLENRTRFLSSSVEDAVPTFGDSPKDWEAMSMAFQRSYDQPNPAYLSRLQTRALSLANQDRMYGMSFDFAQPNTERTQSLMRLGDLEGSFVSTVSISYQDPDTKEWQQLQVYGSAPAATAGATVRSVRNTATVPFNHSEVRDSGYEVITLQRLQDTIEEYVPPKALDSALVDVEFFHPRTQPETMQHNVYFEGVSHELSSDFQNSLISSLWFSRDGLSPLGQAGGIGAPKKGLAAVRSFLIPRFEEVKAAELTAITDLDAVIQKKVDAFMQADIIVDAKPGKGQLPPEYRKAVYKMLKHLHFVYGTNAEGELDVWPAERVLEYQANGTPIDLEGMTLYVPSISVLRGILGDVGTKGALLTDPTELRMSAADVPLYTGLQENQKQILLDAIRGNSNSLERTAAAARPRLGTSISSPYQTASNVAALDERVRSRFAGDQDSIAERMRLGSDFNRTEHLSNAFAAAQFTMQHGTFTADLQGIPIPAKGPGQQRIDEATFQWLQKILDDNALNTAWVHNETATEPNPEIHGVRTKYTMANERDLSKANRLISGDVVMLDLDSFYGAGVDEAKAQDTIAKRVRQYAERGVTLVFTSKEGRRSILNELAMTDLLASLDMVKAGGSQYVFVPRTSRSWRNQNQISRESTLTEVREINGKDRHLVLVTGDAPTHEGSLWVNPTYTDLADAGLQTALLHTDAYANYNVELRDERRVTYVKQQVSALLSDTDALQDLLDRSGGDIDTTDPSLSLSAAVERLVARWNANPSASLLPQEGDDLRPGDIIPLLHTDGQHILLYRYGFQAPDTEELRQQFAGDLAQGLGASYLAVFKPALEIASLPRSGKVESITPRQGHGYETVLRTELQIEGGKLVSESNGLKYILSVIEDQDLPMPKEPVFANGRQLMGITDSLYLIGKDGLTDLVRDARSAISVFGLDPLPLLAEAFFPNSNVPAPVLQERARTLLRVINRQLAGQFTVAQVDAMLSTGGMTQTLLEELRAMEIPGQDEIGLPADWATVFGGRRTPAERLAYATVLYLMTPGADTSHILNIGGLTRGGDSRAERSYRTADLWATVFDDLRPENKELRDWFFDQLNDRLAKVPGSDAFSIDHAYNVTMEVMLPNGKTHTATGHLMALEALFSTDNPTMGAAVPAGLVEVDYSYHNQALAAQAINGLYALRDNKLNKNRLLFDVDQVRYGGNKDTFKADQRLLWEILRDTPKKDSSFQSAFSTSPAEQIYSDESAGLVAAYRVPLNMDDWQEVDKKLYAKLRLDIMREYNLLPSQAEMVDYWIRQSYGAPHGVDENDQVRGLLQASGVIQEARSILRSAQNGYLPTTGGEVPLLALADLQVIFNANKNADANRWKIRDIIDAEVTKDANGKTKVRKAANPRIRVRNSFIGADEAGAWDSWVLASLGSVVLDDANMFDPMFLVSLDGFYQSYRGATSDTLGLPVSMDTLRTLQLLDDETNHKAVSLVMPRDALLNTIENPDGSRKLSLLSDMMFSGPRIASSFKGNLPRAAEISKRRARARAWHYENDIPMTMKQGMKSLRERGIEIAASGSTTSAFYLTLQNMALANSTINPGLWTGSIIEKFMRRTLDSMTDMVAGSGVSTELKVAYNRATKTLGGNPQFRNMVNRDTYYQPASTTGPWHTRWSGKAAKFGTRFQDSQIGQPQKQDAEAYLAAATRFILSRPMDAKLTPATLYGVLQTDPHFLQNGYPEAHAAGMRAVESIRGMNKTFFGAITDGVISPMSNSSRGLPQFFGNVLLQIPFMFRGYLANTAMLLTGTQVISPALASMFEGRQKGLIGAMQRKMSGLNTDAIEDTFDLSAVTQGQDLMRLYLQGGLTHTALFTAGLIAGGLGLSGEDEETKRRKKLAKLANGVYWRDPYAAQNDYRNKGAIDISGLLPDAIEGFFTDPQNPDSRAFVHMPWMLNVFVAPIIGMERFFETGDIGELNRGFMEAIGGLPYTGEMSISEIWSTASEMSLAAQTDSVEDDIESMSRSTKILTNLVGYWERKLFENTWLSMTYVALDEYNRDPYVLPDTNNVGEMYMDKNGNPVETTGLRFFVNDDGQVQGGYAGRSEYSAILHSLSMKRPTLALLGSILDGGLDSDMIRYNMPVKTEDIDLPDPKKSDIKKMVFSAWKDAGAKSTRTNLTEKEAEQAVRNALHAQTGQWYGDDQVLPLVAGFMAEKNALPVLNKQGAKGLIKELADGTWALTDENMRGLFIPKEMRYEIQEEWQADLVREGMSLGLDRGQAEKRMMRIWLGPLDEPEARGIGDILFDKKIPDDGKRMYQQLNSAQVMGPDGRAHSAGFTRGGFSTLFGLPIPRRMYNSRDTGLRTDNVGNVQDAPFGLNTGMRGVRPIDASMFTMTDEEIAKGIINAIENLDLKPTTPFENFDDGGGGGGYRRWGRFGRGGYRRRGGYGGGGGGGSAYFTRLNPLPDGQVPYGNTVPFINTSNPILRRASIRRERVSSERGRLNQWQ